MRKHIFPSKIAFFPQKSHFSLKNRIYQTLVFKILTGTRSDVFPNITEIMATSQIFWEEDCMSYEKTYFVLKILIYLSTIFKIETCPHAI